MAEDFPGYRYEDSDDDSSSERSYERPPITPPAPELPPAKAGDEGTIFARDPRIASELSRPLFDFIRQQQQSETRFEAPALNAQETDVPDRLPSASSPEDPEVRTYQPPLDAEVAAQAAREAELDDDDDEDDEESKNDELPVRAPDAAAQPTPELSPAPNAEQQPKVLNEQFEEIMNAEMGEDFARSTSGERLTNDMPDETDPSRVADDNFREPSREWPAPVVPDVRSNQESPIPTPNPIPEAFYYTEDHHAAPVPVDSGSSTSSSRPSVVPPTPPYGGGHHGSGGSGGGGAHGGGGAGGSGGGSGGGPTGAWGFGMPPAGFNALNYNAPYAHATYPAESSPATVVRHETTHRGRWFVAGFITGWVVKQYLANKKMRAQQAEHEKSINAQQQQIESLQYDQYHTGQKLKRTEAEMQQLQAQEARAAQAAQAAEASRFGRQPNQGYEQQPGMAAGGVVAAGSIPETQQSFGLTANQSPRPTMAETPFTATAAAVPASEGIATTAALAGNPGISKANMAESAPRTHQQIAQEAVEMAYQMQNGQSVEQPGGSNIANNYDGEGQEPMPYGEEFRRQRRKELGQTGGGSNGSAVVSASSMAGGAVNPGAGGMYIQPDQRQAYNSNIVTGLDSGQVSLNHELPTGQLPPANTQHLLPVKTSNPMVATLTSPWLWASLMVLIIAFFIAAFI